MKITRSTNKEQLKEFLSANYAQVKKSDKTLAQSIMYASTQDKKDPKLVKRADLIDLAKQVMTLLGDKVVDALAPTPTPVVAENSVKPKLKAKGQKSAEKSEEEAPQQTAEPEKKPQAKSEKKQTSKAEPKKEAPKTDIADSSMFPKTLKVGDSEYTLAPEIKSMKDLLEAFNNEEEIVFAFYWTARLLKQFDYAGGKLKAPKRFDNDLDLATTLYVSDEGKVCFNLSMYTEALYQVLPDAFEEVDGVRYNEGIEYQIYKLNK